MSSSPRPAVVVRDATPSDLCFTARQHEALLPHGLFPLLGRRFLERWHATFLDSPFGIALIAELRCEGGAEPVGFLLGSTDQARLVADVIARHRLPLLVSGSSALLRRPRLMLHFVRTRSGPYLRRLVGRPSGAGGPTRDGSSSHGPSSAPQPTGRIAVLSAVAVDPRGRSQGAGQSLVERFALRASLSGAEDLRLTTVAGADGAGRFYEKLGWRFVEQHPTRDGLLVSTYRCPPEGHA